MSRTIKLELTKAGIAQAIKEIEEYKNEIKLKNVRFISELTRRGISIIQINISNYNLGGTEIASGIGSETMVSDGARAMGILFARSDHVAYVEFGTGIVGQSNPYPANTPIPWEYATGEKIKTIHFADGNVALGWKYYDEKEGRWRVTSGLPSRPFMYKSSIDLRNEIISIAREVFNGN